MVRCSQSLGLFLRLIPYLFIALISIPREWSNLKNSADGPKCPFRVSAHCRTNSAFEGKELPEELQEVGI